MGQDALKMFGPAESMERDCFIDFFFFENKWYPNYGAGWVREICVWTSKMLLNRRSNFSIFGKKYTTLTKRKCVGKSPLLTRISVFFFFFFFFFLNISTPPVHPKGGGWVFFFLLLPPKKNEQKKSWPDRPLKQQEHIFFFDQPLRHISITSRSPFDYSFFFCAVRWFWRVLRLEWTELSSSGYTGKGVEIADPYRSRNITSVKFVREFEYFLRFWFSALILRIFRKFLMLIFKNCRKLHFKSRSSKSHPIFRFSTFFVYAKNTENTDLEPIFENVRNFGEKCSKLAGWETQFLFQIM